MLRRLKAQRVGVVGALSLALAFIFFRGQALADNYISPDLIEVTTPVYRPDNSPFEPALGTYTYDVSWQGIPAAQVQVKVDLKGDQYHLITTAKTNSAIDLFYRLRYRAEGYISGFDFTPVRTTITQHENSRYKNTVMSFLEGGEILSVREQKGGETKTLRFKSNNFTLDPFAAAFLARSLDWQKGQSRQFDTFNGKSRYLITLTAEDEIKMDVNGAERRVWVISPKVVNLTQKNPQKKLRSAKIYVTADPAREILQIVSKVFVGSVTTELEAFKPSKTRTQLVRAALRKDKPVS